MKLLVVSLLAAFVASVLAKGYLPGKEYVYKYKAKIYSEFDQQHHQHAGVAFKSEVIVQPKEDHFLFKVGHVVYDKLNERVDKERGYDFDYKENAALSEALQKPFEVYLQHGLVHHLKVASDDPIWSVNLKKSLAGLFQVNFEQRHPVRDGDGGAEHSEEKKLDEHYFKVMEDSLYGECETVYEISHDHAHEVPKSVFVLNVTKSVNFGHCVKLPYYIFENVNYEVCEKCEADIKNPDRLSDVMHYNLRGDRHSYVIEKVHTESEYNHMPWGRNGFIGYVHTNRTIILVDERDVLTEIEAPSETVSHYDLHFHFFGQHNFQEKMDLKDPHYYYYFLGKSADADIIGKEFQDLVAPIIDGTFEEKFQEHRAPARFVEIVKHLGSLGYDDIEKIYKSYVDVPSDDPHAILINAQMFLEILSSTGTNPAFLFAKNHLFEPIILPKVREHFVVSLPFHLKEASETLFDEFYRLCEDERVEADDHLQDLCYLAFSSVINEHCVGKNYLRGKRLTNALGENCNPELAKKYFDFVVRHFEKDHDDSHLITAIKVAGNFGLKDGIPYLRKYIDNNHLDNHYSTYFRVAAIWALHKIASEHSEDVLEVVVPVYFDSAESHEVRVAAFGIIMACHPSRAILEAIGVSLHEEHNHQVLAYVTSALTYLSKSDYPCHQAIKPDIEHVMRHVLRINHPPQFDLKHSQYWINEGYNEDYGVGGMTKVSYITSNDSYLPSRIHLGLYDYIFGKDVKSLSLTFSQEGLDKFFDRILGPEGLFQEHKSVFDLFHRRVARDTASVEKELKEIDDVLHIKPRHGREIHGDLSVKMFGHEVSFLHFNESLFDNFFRDGYFGVPDIQNILKNIPGFTFTRFFIQGNFILILPSCVGFPVFLAYQEPTAIFYKNEEFNFEVTPNAFAEDRNNEPPTDVSLRIKGRLIHDTVRRGVMGISLSFEHTTLGIGVFRRTYFNQPYDVDFHLDLKHWKLTSNKTLHVPNNLIHVCAHPFTYIDDYSNSLDSVSETGFLPYYKISEMGEYHQSYFHDALGAGYSVNAKYGKLDVFRTPSHAKKFFTEHSLRDSYYLLLFNPKLASYDLDINSSAADHDPTHEVEFEVDFDYHGPGDGKLFHSEIYNENQEDLEELSKALPGRELFTYSLSGHLTRKGPRERKLTAEVTYTHSCDNKLQKLTFFTDRTPYLASETEHSQVCVDGHILYPDYDMKKLHDLDTLSLDEEVKVSLDIAYGKDCKDHADQKIKVHGALKRGARQILLDSKREEHDHLHYNPYSHYYHKCKEEHDKGLYYGINCNKYIALSTMMTHYDIDFDFDRVPSQHFLNNSMKFWSSLDKRLHNHKDVDYTYRKNDSLKIEAHFDFSPKGGKTVNIELLRPVRKVHYDDVLVPKYFKPTSASPYLSFTNLGKINRGFFSTYCNFEGEYVNTYDNVTYHLPPVDCWMVLSKDCSEKEYFLILGKNTNYATHTKAVRAFLGKTKVEILPVTEDAEPIVRVNGHKVDVTETTSYSHQTEGEHSEPDFYVSYNGLYYIIHSPKYEVEIFYDGKAIISEIARYYRGKQCGLCGDYNRESDGEFQGPEDCEYHDVNDFVASYAIRQDGCHAPEVKHTCDHHHHHENEAS